MIDWFTTLLVIVASIAAVLGVILGLLGRVPGDLVMGATALVFVLLLVQLGISIVAPLAGNHPTGSLLEFWVYLVSATLLPAAGGFWALLERSRWSTVILGIANLSVAIMAYRMWQIWTVQGA